MTIIECTYYIYSTKIYNLNVSEKCVFSRGFAQAHRVIHGRASVEPGLQRALLDRNKKFNSHFKVTSMMMKRKPTKAEIEMAEKGEVNLGPLEEDGCKVVERTGVSTSRG